MHQLNWCWQTLPRLERVVIIAIREPIDSFEASIANRLKQLNEMPDPKENNIKRRDV